MGSFHTLKIAQEKFLENFNIHYDLFKRGVDVSDLSENGWFLHDDNVFVFDHVDCQLKEYGLNDFSLSPELNNFNFTVYSKDESEILIFYSSYYEESYNPVYSSLVLNSNKQVKDVDEILKLINIHNKSIENWMHGQEDKYGQSFYETSLFIRLDRLDLNIYNYSLKSFLLSKSELKKEQIKKENDIDLCQDEEENLPF